MSILLFIPRIGGTFAYIYQALLKVLKFGFGFEELTLEKLIEALKVLM
jgi:hypothetical protein